MLVLLLCICLNRCLLVVLMLFDLCVWFIVLVVLLLCLFGLCLLGVCFCCWYAWVMMLCVLVMYLFVSCASCCGVVYFVVWFGVDSGGFCLLTYIWWLFWLCFDDCVNSVDYLCGLVRDIVFWWLTVLVFVAWMFGVCFSGWLFPIDDLFVVGFVSARFGLCCGWLLIV